MKIIERVKRVVAAVFGGKQQPKKQQRSYEEVLAESRRELAKGR